MIRALALLLALVAPPALAAGPVIWQGNNSFDLSSLGLISKGLTVNHDDTSHPSDYVSVNLGATTGALGLLNYTGVYEHPSIDLLEGQYYGVRVAPTIDAGGGGTSAIGVAIDMAGVTAETKIGLAVNGQSTFTTSGWDSDTPITDAVINTANQMNGEFIIGNDETLTGVGGYALIPQASLTVGDNTSLTSAHDMGYAGIAPHVIASLGAGSSLDYANAVAAFAYAGGGTVGHLTGYLAVLSDSTPSATNAYGFRYAEPFTVDTPNKYAFYSGVPSANVFFAGDLQLGDGDDHKTTFVVEDADTDVAVTLPRITSTVLSSIALVVGQEGTEACEAAFGTGAGSCLGCKAEGSSASVACNVEMAGTDLFCACLGDIP